MAVNFLQLMAQALGGPSDFDENLPGVVDEEGNIVAAGQGRAKKVPVIAPDVIPVGAPQIAQPAYRPAPADMQDPAMVNANDPSLLDRRLMIFNAQEAQRKAAAEAAGAEYKPRTQNDLEEFKAKPGLQFGTKGVLRDIIGNGFDWLGSLVGRDPTYRKERWMDEMYGWDQPGQRDAAISRAMQYDPKLTMEFLKGITSVEGQEANTAATSEYKRSQTEANLAKRLGGMATALINGGNPEKHWDAYRPVLPQQLDALNDPMVLPEKYDPNVAYGLSRYGYGPGDTQRESAVALTEENKRIIADNKNITARDIASLRASSQERIARMMNSNRYSIAQIRAEVQREIAANKPMLIEEDDGVFPVTRTYAPASTVVGGGREGQRVQNRKTGKMGTVINGQVVPD